MKYRILTISMLVLLGVGLGGCGSDAKDKPKVEQKTEQESKPQNKVDDNKGEDKKPIQVDKLNYATVLEGKMKIGKTTVPVSYNIWTLAKKNLVTTSYGAMKINILTTDDQIHIWNDGSATGTVIAVDEVDKKDAQKGAFGVDKMTKILKGEDDYFKKLATEKVLGYDTVVVGDKKGIMKMSIAPELYAVLKLEFNVPNAQGEGVASVITATKFEKGKAKPEMFELPKDVVFEKEKAK